MPWIGLKFVIVIVPDHTHLFFNTGKSDVFHSLVIPRVFSSGKSDVSLIMPYFLSSGKRDVSLVMPYIFSSGKSDESLIMP